MTTSLRLTTSRAGLLFSVLSVFFKCTLVTIMLDVTYCFCYSLPKDDVSQSQSQLMCTKYYSSSQLTSEEDFLSNNMILPIANIIQLDQVSALNYFNLYHLTS
jgi:hypothetical protein